MGTRGSHHARRTTWFRFMGVLRVRRARGMAVVLAALVVVASVLVWSELGATGNRSGLPWRSGLYPGDAAPAGAQSFAAWRGRPVDVVDAWSARATWADIVDPRWLYRRWAGQPYTMAFGVAMLPEHVPGVSLQACAAGAYNAHWRQFGQVISAYGLGRSIIRLGWELNGNWYTWQANAPSAWAGCWRQIVTSTRLTAPHLQWDWNVVRGVQQGLKDPIQAYPGNSYVTMIGVDSYDEWPSARSGAGWQVQLNGPQGLNYWLAFARAHGKQLSVPEWGNVYSGTSAGGDDAAYVTDMKHFFAANAAKISYEANFQTGVGGSFTTGGAYGPGTVVPKASAAYKSAF